jgi:hypothetical protein
VARGSPARTMNFDTLTSTWEHLAAEINAKFLTEKADLDFALDLERLPFGHVLFRDMRPMQTWSLSINRPCMNVVFKNWEILLKATYPTRSNKNLFIVTAQANFNPTRPFYIRAIERSTFRSFFSWFQRTGLGNATKEWAKSVITRKPPWLSLQGETVIDSHRVQSGLSEFDSGFSIEATDEEVVDRLFASRPVREQLLALKDSIKMVVFRSMPNSEPNCVFLYGRVDGKCIDQSRQLLTFVEVALDSLLALELILPPQK